jgi:hypothetical protein
VAGFAVEVVAGVEDVGAGDDVLEAVAGVAGVVEFVTDHIGVGVHFVDVVIVGGVGAVGLTFSHKNLFK